MCKTAGVINGKAINRVAMITSVHRRRPKKRASKDGNGKLVWGVSYGKEQYYEKPNKSKDKNPNARGHWFDFAKSVRLKEWLRIANGGGN